MTALERGEHFAGFRIAQHQRQRFRRDHHDIGAAFLRQAAIARRRIAGAHRDRPRNAEFLDRRAQRFHRIGGERAQRRDPQHAQLRRTIALRARRRLHRLQQRTAERGERFAAAGRRVQQTGFAAQETSPHLALEWRGSPAAFREPVEQRLIDVAHRASAFNVSRRSASANGLS